jgi:hypothetical protein
VAGDSIFVGAIKASTPIARALLDFFQNRSERPEIEPRSRFRKKSNTQTRIEHGILASFFLERGAVSAIPKSSRPCHYSFCIILKE